MSRSSGGSSTHKDIQKHSNVFSNQIYIRFILGWLSNIQLAKVARTNRSFRGIIKSKALLEDLPPIPSVKPNKFPEYDYNQLLLDLRMLLLDVGYVDAPARGKLYLPELPDDKKAAQSNYLGWIFQSQQGFFAGAIHRAIEKDIFSGNGFNGASQEQKQESKLFCQKILPHCISSLEWCSKDLKKFYGPSYLLATVIGKKNVGAEQKSKIVLALLADLKKDFPFHFSRLSEVALQQAIFHGVEELVEKLLKEHDYTTRDPGFYQDLLELALKPIEPQHIKRNIVESIIKLGANFKDLEASTDVFYKPIFRGDAQGVSLLLELKANPNPALPSPAHNLLQTCLRVSSNTETLQVLIEGGVEFNDPFWLISTAMSWALKKNSRLFNGAVAALLQGGPQGKIDPNIRSPEGVPLLVTAASSGNFHDLQILLEQKADPLLADREGRTALMFAAFRQDQRMVTLLLVLLQNLSCVEQINAKDKYGFTAMARAVQHDLEKISWPVLQLLIDSHADLNQPAGPALVNLMKHKLDKNQFAYLLEHKADINRANWEGCTPLMAAVKTNNDHILNLLLEHKAIHQKDSDGISALGFALQQYQWSAQFEKVLRLIQSGASVNDETIDGYNGLLIAIFKEDQNQFHKFLEMKCDPNLRNKNGYNVLEEMLLSTQTLERKKVWLEKLLEAKADINQADKEGRTPLMAAAQKGGDALSLLLDHKAALNVRDHKGCSALGYALTRRLDGMTEITKLLKAGADKQDQSPKGDTLVSLVQERDNLEFIIELTELMGFNMRDVHGHTLLMMIASAPNCWIHGTAAFKHVLENTADVNVTDNNGQTALFYLCGFNLMKMMYVKPFIDKGMQVNHRDNQGNTALITAVLNKNAMLVKTLLDKKADASIANNQGQTAVLLAQGMFANPQEQTSELIKILEHLGASSQNTSKLAPKG